MPRFKVPFLHTVKIAYDAFVDADSEDEAKILVKEDPFNYVEPDDEGIEKEGIDIEILDPEEIED